MTHLTLKLFTLLYFCTLVGCGLDGVSGRLIRIEGESYVLKVANGEEMTLRVDHRTRKDDVVSGDAVHAYVTKDRYAEFLQRLE